MKTGIILSFFLLFSHVVIAAEVACLSVEQGRKVLVAEREKSYFPLLQQPEIQAKAGQVPPVEGVKQQQTWLREVYTGAVLACTAEEERALGLYVEHLEQALSERYPGLFRLPWRFIKVTNAVESGLPHTAGEAIVLSTAFIH